jgi:plastocyanin
VNWSVNSTPGGNSTLGTISSSGLYTAPATIATGSANVSVVASSQSSPAITGSASIALSYPSPKITSVAPNAINAGSAATVVTIQGSNFTTASSVYLGTSAISTSFVSSSTLQATIPASSLNLAGALSVDVTNPQPGGGSSASQQISVVPQLVSVTPNSAPVGGSVNLQLTGVDSSNASSVVVSFAQTGKTFAASSGTFTSSVGSPQLTLVVPSGLAPASTLAQFSAPAQISVSVDSIPATTALPFTVQPPTHAGSITPATVETNLSVQTSLTGVATSFDSTTTITSDDPGITFSGVTANSSTILLATMQVGNGAVVGPHTITVTTQVQSLAYSLEVASSTAAPVISSVSPATAASATPITIAGTGFGASTGANVVLRFAYNGSEVDTPATIASSTEIDSYMPVLMDSTSGGLYAGAVSMAIIVNGQPSNSFDIALPPLPANASAVGTTTLAAIDAVIANATSAQTQLSNSTLISSAQSQSAAGFYASILTSLQALRANVVTAASGQNITNPDGSTFNAAAIDILDRLLQSATPPGQLSPLATIRSSHARTNPQAQSGSSLPDKAYQPIGSVCSSIDNNKALLDYVKVAAVAFCAGSLVDRKALPVCGALSTFAINNSLLPEIGGLVCDALPINLGAVKPAPQSIDLATNGSSVTESPIGTFESSPKLAGNSVESLAEFALEKVPQIGTIVEKIIGNPVVAMEVTDLIGQGIGNALKGFVDTTLPSWGIYGSQTTALTMNTTSLEDEGFLSPIVTISGMTVAPIESAVGQTTLFFAPQSIRMFDMNGDATSDAKLVPGNKVPVTVSNETIVVNPSTATVAPGGTQQFAATVQGSTSTAVNLVNWSVDQVAGGNATVGTISDQGLYTAPIIIPNPATVSITATDPKTMSSGTATVSVGGAPPTYFLVGNWAGTATYVQADGNQSVSYSVGVSLSQTATSFTGTFTGLEDSVPQTYTIVGQLAGNNMTFSIASTADPDTESAAGTISANGLQVTGSGGESSSGSIVWNGNSQITGSAMLEPGAGEGYESTSWTGNISTDGQHLTGGAKATNGDTITWSLTRQ